MESEAERSRCVQGINGLIFHVRNGPDQQSHRGNLRHQFADNSRRLALVSELKILIPVTFPPGRFKLATSPNLTGSSTDDATMGIVDVAALAAFATGSPPAAEMTLTLRRTKSAARSGRVSISTFRPPVLNCDVAALDVTDLAQSTDETPVGPPKIVGEMALSQPDHRHRAAAPVHATGHAARAAEQRDELAPPHSITSSARASSVGGNFERRAP